MVDDCSSDRTYQRACEIAKNQPRIKVIRNPGQLFCGMTYLKALNQVQGKYVGVLDGDDTLMPNAISTIVKYYEKYPAIDFIWTKHKWHNGEMTRCKPGISHSADRGTIFQSEDGCRHIYSHWRTFRAEMRERGVLFRDLKCTVDKDLGYNLEELGKGAFLPLELYNYRYHRENMSHHSQQKAKWREIRKYHKPKSRNESVVMNVAQN